MKKIIFALAAAAVMLTSGCFGSSPNSSSQAASHQSHTVVLDNLGLTYTTPALWSEFETTNIYPLTIQSEGTLARIIYNYIKTEDIEKVTAASGSSSYTDYLTPICEIMVAPTENIENGSLENLITLYKNNKTVGQQGDYTYMVLYPFSENSLEGEDLKNFNKLTDSVPELIESISTRDFNPDDIKPLVDTSEISGYITFDTVTLEGEKIDSTVFSQYDLTMVNFWGTYAIDKSNEQAVLQEVYEKCLSYKDKKLNVINAVVDTPNKENEELVKQLKEEAGGKFTTIVMDETLANWAVENLEGVPTTIFVDSEGKIVGGQIKGAKTADTYFSELESVLYSLD